MAGRARRFLGLSLILTGLVFGSGPLRAEDVRFPVLAMILSDTDGALFADHDSAIKGMIKVSMAGSDVSFSFDVKELKALGTITVRADFPKGRREHLYEGPLLKDVLAAAGVSGDTVTIHALDGFMAEISIDDLISRGAVLAYKRDGRMFGVDDFGPAQIVFPRAERADLKDMGDEYWLWSVFHIRVE